MKRRRDEEDQSVAPGTREGGACLRDHHAFLLRWGTSREIGVRIAELRRIASWWASKVTPAVDDDAGSGLDTALRRLATVRQAAEEVEAALAGGGYEFDGHLRVLRALGQPPSAEDLPPERTQELLSETILEVFDQLNDGGQPRESTSELRLQIRARLAHCLHPDLLSDGSIETVLDGRLNREGSGNG